MLSQEQHFDQPEVTSDASVGPLVFREVGFLLLLAVLSFLLAVVAYQAPITGRAAVGGPLSRAFLGSSEAQNARVTEQGLFYADELDQDGGRSRWSRQRATIRFAGLGEKPGPLELTIRAQGWPTDTLGVNEVQPDVAVSANDHPIGEFTPTRDWNTYGFVIPAGVSKSDLTLVLKTSSVFTATQNYPQDIRPKGIRLRVISLTPATPPPFPRLPDWGVVLGVVGAGLLSYGIPRRLGWRRWIALIVMGAMLLGFVLLIAAARIWAASVLRVLLPLLVLILTLAFMPVLGQLYRRFSLHAARSGALALGLLAAAVVALGWFLVPVFKRSFQTVVNGIKDQEVEAIAQAPLFLLAVSLILLVLLNLEVLSRSAQRLQARLILGRSSVVLFLVLLAGWLAYQWSIVRLLPFVGHADYADNAVVARNLLRGRGWVVDYVTQFYYLYPGGSVIRLQETWPLLQPVWILPFFAAFGPQVWAAKIPNLIFNGLLGIGIFAIGAQLWDRRVGLIGAILTLTNQFFFNLTIFTTSDLAFVVFATVAVALFFVAHEDDWQHDAAPREWWVRTSRLLMAGLFTGLMCLQKPSGVILAGGMGLWWLIRWIKRRRGWESLPVGWRRMLLAWALPALLILSPYLARNVTLFGAPFYSTESYDAWVLDFRGDRAWDDIYKVFTRQGGLEGQGLPDPSWILRWGYDRTYQKMADQFEATAAFLLPPLPPLEGLGGKAQLVGLVTTWLAIIGVLVALGRGRKITQLLGLLLAVFVPYILFLCLYWHADEERYFLPLVPWIALFAGAGLVAIIDSLAWSWRGGAVFGTAVAVVLLVLAVQQYHPQSETGWQRMSAKLERDLPSWQADIRAFEWLRNNTSRDSVVMTRVPWQLSFHADRPAVMIPNTSDRQTIFRLAQYYRAEYLLVGAITDVSGDVKRALKPLIAGQETQGFKLVHSVSTPTNRTIFIYRFPSDYGGVARIETP